jgi:glutamate synthase (NADPH/NADH)
MKFDAILKNALEMRKGVNIKGGTVAQDFDLEKRLDNILIEKSVDVMEGKASSVNIDMKIVNEQRTFGATLSNKISLKFGEEGLPDDSININLTGSAGQSFCAFLAKGVTVTLEGDSNDYVGKCLSGGKIIVRPPKNSAEGFKSEENVIVGNVCLYGATSGKAFFRGLGAERFCVRNSGVTAVIEGVGDHGCEYMTGGRTIILGPTGRNFAAGMSGGIAYVLDDTTTFYTKCNQSMVDLLPVEKSDDLKFLKSVLEDFVACTESEVAQNILSAWPESATRFVKVFPHEYQRALKELEEEKVAKRSPVKVKSSVNGVHENGNGVNGTNGSHVNGNGMNGTNGTHENGNGINGTNGTHQNGSNGTHENGSNGTHENGVNGDATAAKKPIIDIEDSISDTAMKKKKQEVLLDKTRGFVKYKRETKLYRDPASRQKDWDEIYDFKNVRRGLKTQAARCMDCGVPFCHSVSHGCPLGNIIPKFNDLVFNDDWKEALNQLTQTNNFPEFTGRVCPAPCEGACVLGINEPPVTIKNIECSIIDNGFEKGWIKASPPATRTGKTVAIVGSGPSGLAAADQLNKAGHSVTVFERNNRIGGLLMYGIPTMKLSKEVVQRRVDLMAEEGIEFKPNTDVGKDISPKELDENYDSVLLCLGATWPRDLPIPDRDAEGIHFAMEFLQTWQQKQHGDNIDHLPLSAKDKDVIVIGGGDTGCDCIGTSLRQGAKSITTFEILPQPPNKRAEDNPWPQYPRLFKVDYGHEEVVTKWGGDPRRYNTMSKQFLKDDNGRVSGIETVMVEWTKDENGRWKMAEVEGSEKTYECQIVLLAMGFLGPEKAILEELELEKDPRGNIKTPKGKYSTNMNGVFAAGDCRRGQSLVVWGITEGRQAAREVDVYLSGSSALPGPAGIIIPQKHAVAQG